MCDSCCDYCQKSPRDLSLNGFGVFVPRRCPKPMPVIQLVKSKEEAIEMMKRALSK